MRTTLTLDPDVAAKAKKGAAKLGKPFKEVINTALRLGLEQVLNPPTVKPYRTVPRPLGLRRGFRVVRCELANHAGRFARQRASSNGPARRIGDQWPRRRGPHS